MKKSKNSRYVSRVILFIVAAAAIMVYIRLDNPQAVRLHFLRQWREAYLVRVPHQPESYVRMTPTLSPRHFETTSEATGYGMLLLVLGQRQHAPNVRRDFDRLYRYYLANQIPGSTLMQWRQSNWHSQPADSRTSASDGDVLIAHALLLASRVWDEPHYREASLKLQADILKYEVNPTTHLLTVGNWAKPKTRYYQLLRTSDVIPYAFDAFYHASKRPVWRQIGRDMMARLATLSRQNRDGLIPDFAWATRKGTFPVVGKTVATAYDGAYYYNACRIPLNLAGYSSKSARAINLKLLNFFKKARYIGAGYHLSGKAIHRYQSASFDAPIFLAVSKLPTAAKSAHSVLFTREQYIFSGHLPINNYYDATLTIMALLFQTGEQNY
ncbi:MAG: glycosyl hydrolase family 8 [Lactobacillus sp.]|nr:glycosyl hydrolase family 8 [Lactobacillus sp.]